MADHADLERFRSLIEHRRFQFAKSMPQIPHWYTMSKWWPRDERDLFLECAGLIRRCGFDRKFGRRTFRYLNLNGWKYWFMDERVEDCVLINRAASEYPGNPFDSVADFYDERFADPAHVQEDRELIAMLDIMPSDRVLDVGAGTGMLLDRLPGLHANRYVGCEPSTAMRTHFQAKHPDHTILASTLEDTAAGTFDVIVALYGTASYLSPGCLPTIRERLRPSGRLFLMFYDDDYEPVSCVGGEPSNHMRGTRVLVPGDAERWHDYWIVR
jgi:SAM-dependent methyltransferase